MELKTIRILKVAKLNSASSFIKLTLQYFNEDILDVSPRYLRLPLKYFGAGFTVF